MTRSPTEMIIRRALPAFQLPSPRIVSRIQYVQHQLRSLERQRCVGIAFGGFWTGIIVDFAEFCVVDFKFCILSYLQLVLNHHIDWLS